jgi:hypothetical protein
MGIQSFTPSSGGGTPGFDYIASVRMETYNRSWTQAGAAGNYVVTSNNNNSGYVYFVTTGGTVGTPLGQVINLTSPFTRLDIVAPTNDFISLYKVSVKSTSLFNNALAGFSAFPSIMNASGNFVLPNASLPLVDVMLVGAGGSAHGHGSGGGGGGIVKLTAYQAVGTTSVTIGANAGNATNVQGGASYFGNVYALGGGGGFASKSQTLAQTHGNGANGAGASHAGTGEGGTGGGIAGIPGTTQTAGTGLNTKGSPTYTGGHRGGNLGGGFTLNHGGAGGGGGGGVGGDRNGTSGAATGGLGHVSNFSGSNVVYSAGGGGAHHTSPAESGNYASHSDAAGYGWGRNSTHDASNQSGNGNGVVMVRYYIP